MLSLHAIRDVLHSVNLKTTKNGMISKVSTPKLLIEAEIQTWSHHVKVEMFIDVLVFSSLT